jgi:hypothetical protein
MEHFRLGKAFCDFWESLHALRIENCICCVACVESVHSTDKVAQAGPVLTVPSRAPRVLGIFSKPLLHLFVFDAGGVFIGITYCAMVELAVSEVSSRSFPNANVVEVRCLVDETLRVHREEPIVYDITVFWMEAVEEVGVAFFIRKLLCKTERVTNLKETPIVEHYCRSSSSRIHVRAAILTNSCRPVLV